jgi:hypothetical protein
MCRMGAHKGRVYDLLIPLMTNPIELIDNQLWITLTTDSGRINDPNG